MNREGVLLALCGLLDPLLGRPLPPYEAGEWEAIVALASAHAVTPALAWALRSRTFGGPIDDYAAGMLTLNRLRNARFAAALPPLLAALNAVDATPVLLKGAAALADDLYPVPETRFLADIDILVPRHRIEAAAAALTRIGYAADSTVQVLDFVRTQGRLGYQHLPMQADPRTGVGVELHWDIFGRAHAGLVSADACLARCETGVFAGETYRTLHPTDRAIHNIAHTQIWHALHDRRRIDLRQLLELMRLDRRDRGRLCWAEVADTFERSGHGAVLRRQAVLLRALFGWTLPPGAPDVSGLALRGEMWRGRPRAWDAVIAARTYARLTDGQPELRAELFWPTLATAASHLSPNWLKAAVRTAIPSRRGKGWPAPHRVD